MRSNTNDAARRSYIGISRGLLIKSNDDPKLQEANVQVLANEQHTGIERFQQYGVSSVPLPGAGGKYPEAIIAYLGGNRSHPVILAVDDRRHRPKGLKPGESVLYDDQGQRIYVSRDGIKIDAGAAQKPLTITNGQLTVTFAKDKATVKVNNMMIVVKPDRIDLGADPAPSAVVTVDGPSSKVFAVT
jgi:phage baseplate assembly protein V